MEEKKIIKNIMFSIVAVLLLIIVLAGSTYAYFRAEGQSTVQEITTANLGINFVDGELLNARLKPIEREDMLAKAAKKTFTITNTGDEKLFVHISMDDINLPDELKRYDLMWSLYEGDKNVSNGTFEAAESKIDVAPYQVFEVNDTKTYNLYVWIEETGINQEAMMNKTFNTVIRAEGELYYTSPEICFTQENGEIIDYDAETCGTDVIIPETIDGVTITKIGDEAFYNDGLTSVVIPNTVTEIGEDAFNSNKLTSVFIPNSVTTICDTVGSSCDTFAYNSIKTISIPNSVSVIGEAVFYLNKLTSIFIPNSVTEIADYTFAGNQTLRGVIIPNSVTKIGFGAFNGTGLENVVIGRGITNIPVNDDISFNAFVDNPKLNKIVIRLSKSEYNSRKNIGLGWNCTASDWNDNTGETVCTKYASIIYAP